MDYPLRFVDQLRPHLKALRKTRGLTQAQAGALVGVSQARIAEIEANPGAVSFEQMMKLLSALGASLSLRDEASFSESTQHAVAEPTQQYGPLPDDVHLPPGSWTATRRSDESVLVRMASDEPHAQGMGATLRELQALNPDKDVKPASRRSFIIGPKRESW